MRGLSKIRTREADWKCVQVDYGLQVGTCRASTWRHGGGAVERGQTDDKTEKKTRSGCRMLFWKIKKVKDAPRASVLTVGVSLLNLFADVRWNDEVNILRTPCPADATSLQGRAKSSSWSGSSIWSGLIAGSCVFQCIHPVQAGAFPQLTEGQSLPVVPGGGPQTPQRGWLIIPSG